LKVVARPQARTDYERRYQYGAIGPDVDTLSECRGCLNGVSVQALIGHTRW
jgi:hypothetical protein